MPKDDDSKNLSPTAYRLLEFAGAMPFYGRTASFLEADEGTNNLILSAAIRLSRAAAARSIKRSFYAVEANGKILSAALNIAAEYLLLSNGTTEASHFMGRKFAEQFRTVDEAKRVLGGVLGPSEAAATFVRGFKDRGHLRLKREQWILQATAINTSQGTSGEMQVAQLGNSDLLLEWTRDSLAESNGTEIEEPEKVSKLVVRNSIESKNLFVWFDQKRIVSMAAFTGETPSGVRIHMVYTPPEHRNKGYASALVAELSKSLLKKKSRSCFLLVDQTNGPALHVYKKLGYKIIGDFSEYRW